MSPMTMNDLEGCQPPVAKRSPHPFHQHLRERQNIMPRQQMMERYHGRWTSPWRLQPESATSLCLVLWILWNTWACV